MKKIVVSVTISSFVLLMLSAVFLYASGYFFPVLTEEYLSPVFRTPGKRDWLYHVHPLVLSIGLKWFWERYKDILKGSLIGRAAELALVYGVVALVPVLWLTYCAIDVSLPMVFSWLLYGLIQAFVIGVVFAWFNP